jgi:hypothetical protein
MPDLDPELAATFPARPLPADEYRLAPQGRETSFAEDMLTGLPWLVAHAVELSVDPSRIALMGAVTAVEAVLWLVQRVWRACCCGPGTMQASYEDQRAKF